MVGLQGTERAHGVTQKLTWLQSKRLRLLWIIWLRRKDLLGQLEVLHQVLFTLGQLKYCLEEAFRTEEEKIISRNYPILMIFGKNKNQVETHTPLFSLSPPVV